MLSCCFIGIHLNSFPLRLFLSSWGADHRAKNWGSHRGRGGSLPFNVHQDSAVPFWQVQDPLWLKREWCPVHRMKEWCLEDAALKLFRPLRHFVSCWLYDMVGLQTLYWSMFATQTFALCIVCLDVAGLNCSDPVQLLSSGFKCLTCTYLHKVHLCFFCCHLYG